VSTMTKVFIVLQAVLTIAVSSLFIGFAAQTENWKDLATRYQEQRNNAVTLQQAQQASLQSALAMGEDRARRLADELLAARREGVALKDELARARTERTQAVNEKLAAEAGRTKLQEILDVQTGELKAAQKENQTLLAQNIDLQSRNSRANSRVLELTTNVTILTDQVRNMQERLTACERRVAGAAADMPAGVVGEALAVAPSVRGEIRAQVVEVVGNYASLNVGESTGVRPGMVFWVYRDGGVYVGDIQIDTVRPNECGGRIVLRGEGQVRGGDRAVCDAR
jgi:hypothetical protein